MTAVGFMDEEGDARISKLVAFGSYARDTRSHLERMCDLIADGDQALREDLRLMVDVLWA